MKKQILKEKKYISAVIYISDSDEKSLETITKIDEFFQQRFENYEFVMVVDSHNIESALIVEKFVSHINGKTQIVTMAWKHGTELSILAGDELALGDFVFEIDLTKVDWEVDLLWEMFEKLNSGFDVISATPDTKTHLSSAFFYKFFKKVSRLRLDLSTETVTLISRRALNSVLMSKEKVRYRKLSYKLSGFATSTVNYHGNKALIKQDGFLNRSFLALNVLTSHSDIGLQLSLFMSCAFFFFSFLIGLYAFAAFLLNNFIVEGWTAIMLFLSLGFSGIFFLLAVLSKYISTIMLEVQDKPLYKIFNVRRL